LFFYAASDCGETERPAWNKETFSVIATETVKPRITPGSFCVLGLAAVSEAYGKAMSEKTLGHYRVGEQLGRGGMGEVYSADDLNLNRKVALKFLPDAFAGDPERMARFEREAKVLASLNHPNIAAIYGLEQAEGKRFLVLELVEGETLAKSVRIAAG
jgi:serine/threonine protein kinase